LICLFPVGIWFCIREWNDERLFIILYAVFASYFASAMIRLILTLTPCVCILGICFVVHHCRCIILTLACLSMILAAIALSTILDYYTDINLFDINTDSSSFDNIDNKIETNETNYQHDPVKKNVKHFVFAQHYNNRVDKTIEEISTTLKIIVVIFSKQYKCIDLHYHESHCCLVLIMLILLATHCTWVTSNAYSSPSIVLTFFGHDRTRFIVDDFREGYYWLRQNTPVSARIMAWWDYGYQIAGMANRTVIVDNNTWNNSHIALVGKAMSSNETEAYKIMNILDVDYVLVIFGGLTGYGGDDVNKFLWMVRIAQGSRNKHGDFNVY
jgi:dolichyl-diphosphooligosaccharide---protein glycosyltransferase